MRPTRLASTPVHVPDPSRLKADEAWRPAVETGVAVALSWWVASDLLGHPSPISAPVVAAVATVRLALKDLELVREVEQSSQAAMPMLDVVLERFLSASKDHADQDLASVYELGRPG